MPETVPVSAIRFYEDRLVTQSGRRTISLAAPPSGNDITAADLGLYAVYGGRKVLINGTSLRNVTDWGDRV